MIESKQNKRTFKLVDDGVLQLDEENEPAYWVLYNSELEKQEQISKWLNTGKPQGSQVCPRRILEKIQTKNGEVVKQTDDWVNLHYAQNCFM